MENNCDIVKDLIPLCIDNAASDASIRLVKSHILTCKECREQVELMKREIRVPSNTDIRIKEAAGMKKMKDYMKKGKIHAVIITVLVMALVVGGIVMGRGFKKQQNENNILGTWAENGVDIMSYDASGTVTFTKDLEEAGLKTGKAVYYFSFIDTVRVVQDDHSVEFVVKIKDNHLSMELMGREYLDLDKK